MSRSNLLRGAARLARDVGCPGDALLRVGLTALRQMSDLQGHVHLTINTILESILGRFPLVVYQAETDYTLHGFCTHDCPGFLSYRPYESSYIQ